MSLHRREIPSAIRRGYGILWYAFIYSNLFLVTEVLLTVHFAPPTVLPNTCTLLYGLSGGKNFACCKYI